MNCVLTDRASERTDGHVGGVKLFVIIRWQGLVAIQKLIYNRSKIDLSLLVGWIRLFYIRFR